MKQIKNLFLLCSIFTINVCLGMGRMIRLTKPLQQLTQQALCAPSIRSMASWQKNPALAMRVPPKFGETNYIVGLPRECIEQERRKGVITPLKAEKGSTRVLFSPDDDVRNERIRVIDEEQESLKIAAYTFSDGDTAKAVCRAYDRGVDVELLTDRTGIDDQYSKIPFLLGRGIKKIYCYSPGKRGSSLFHHKFFVGKNNRDGKPVVVFGSANFSRAGGERNQDNLNISYDLTIVEPFNKQFERMMGRCKLIQLNNGGVSKDILQWPANLTLSQRAAR